MDLDILFPHKIEELFLLLQVYANLLFIIFPATGAILIVSLIAEDAVDHLLEVSFFIRINFLFDYVYLPLQWLNMLSRRHGFYQPFLLCRFEFFLFFYLDLYQILLGPPQLVLQHPIHHLQPAFLVQIFLFQVVSVPLLHQDAETSGISVVTVHLDVHMLWVFWGGLAELGLGSWGFDSFGWGSGPVFLSGFWLVEGILPLVWREDEGCAFRRRIQHILLRAVEL